MSTPVDRTALNAGIRQLPPKLPAGVYRHWRGGTYTLLAIAETHHHNGDLDVVYISHTTGSIVTRPLYGDDSRKQDAWTDLVEWPDGGKRCRFTPDTDETKHLFEGP